MSNINKGIGRVEKLSLDKLTFWPGNPRRGDVDKLKSVLTHIGQVVPIVVQDKGDGSYLVLSGEHRIRAARELGWDEIACNITDLDDETAADFFLTDNYVHESGYTDSADRMNILTGRHEGGLTHDELYEQIGWGVNDMAVMYEAVKYEPEAFDYAEPAPTPSNTHHDDVDEDVFDSVETQPARKKENRLVFQLIFETEQEQEEFQKFWLWLRDSPDYTGTPTRQMLDFCIDNSDL